MKNRWRNPPSYIFDDRRAIPSRASYNPSLLSLSWIASICPWHSPTLNLAQWVLNCSMPIFTEDQWFHHSNDIEEKCTLLYRSRMLAIAPLHFTRLSILSHFPLGPDGLECAAKCRPNSKLKIHNSKIHNSKFIQIFIQFFILKNSYSNPYNNSYLILNVKF